MVLLRYETFTGDAARTEWGPRDEHDPISLAIVDDVIPLAIGETVAVLDRCDGDDPASPFNVFLGDVGEGDHANLPLKLQFGQSFDRNVKRNHIVGGACS